MQMLNRINPNVTTTRDIHTHPPNKNALGNPPLHSVVEIRVTSKGIFFPQTKPYSLLTALFPGL